MAVLPIHLRPTFPLDERRIQGMKRDLIVQSPRLIFGQCAAFVADRLLAAGFGSNQGVLRTWLDKWSSLDDELTARVVRRLVAESNADQDDAIYGMIGRLKQSGYAQYSISLGRLLLLKQHIEQGLHRNGVMSDRKEEIEILVDSICQEVCNELYRIAESDAELAKVLTSRDPKRLDETTEKLKASQKRIMHAYATLYDTASQLAIEAKPLSGSSVGVTSSTMDGPVLDRLIENLREENEMAKAIGERIRTELPDIDRE